MSFSLENEYEHFDGVYVLTRIPKERRASLIHELKKRNVSSLRLKLTSGHAFSVPLVTSDDPGRSGARGGLRSRTVRAAKKMYFHVAPLAGRLGLSSRLRLLGMRFLSKAAMGADEREAIVDDALFEHVGQVLIAFDNFYSNPSTVGLSLTNRCNLECVMCPYHGPEEKKKHVVKYFDETHTISLELFEKVVAFCARNETLLQLGQQDEPLMLIFRKPYYDVLRRHRPILSITTNGTLLRGEKEWRKIGDLARLHHVGVSIDAATPGTYKKIRGGDLEQLHEQLLGFFGYMKKHRPEVKLRVCFVTQPLNKGEEDIFLEFWRRHVHQISFYQLTSYDKGSAHFVPNYKATQRTPCRAIFSGMYVQPDGDVLPCCLFMYNAPYEGRHPIMKFSDDAWRSETYHKMRSSVTSGKFGPICNKCTIWKQGADLETTEKGMRVTMNPFEKNYFVD